MGAEEKDFGPMIRGTAAAVDEARRRMWLARDRVVQLRKDLAAAEAAEAAAERDHADARDLLSQMWSTFRTEVGGRRVMGAFDLSDEGHAAIAAKMRQQAPLPPADQGVVLEALRRIGGTEEEES